MKRFKRLISILLAMILCFGSFSVGVSAAYSDYSYPAGYNALEHPYVSAYQCGSRILDFLDEILAEQEIEFYLDLGIIDPIDINITSVDNALDTLTGIFEMDVYDSLVESYDLGDIEDIEIEAAYRAPRRTTVGRTDLEIVYAVVDFARDNARILGKFVDSELDLGFIDGIIDINELIGDIHELIKEIVFDLLYEDRIDDGKYVHSTKYSTLDDMANELIYNLLFDAEEGLLPDAEKVLVEKGLMEDYGLLYFDINKISVYDLFDAVIDIALSIVKPFLVELFLEDEDDEILPIIMSILQMEVPDINEVTGLPFTREERIDYAINDLLNLKSGALSKYVILDDTGIYLQPAFEELVAQLLQTAQGLISSLNLYPNIDVKSLEEINAMGDAQKLAYMLRTVAVGMIDFVEMPDEVQNGFEVATYFLISFMRDKMPEIDYYGMIKAGTLNPADKNAPLEIAADMAYYYLNANTTMNIPKNLTFDETLQYIITWAANLFDGVIRTNNLDLDTPATAENNVAWKNIDALLWENIFNITWLPDDYAAIFKDADGNFTGNVTKTILFDNILYSIINGDVSKLDDIFKVFRKYQGTIPGYPEKSELDLSIVDFLLTFLKRILNGVVESDYALFEGSSIHCLEDLVSETRYAFGRTNLRIIVQNLCSLLWQYDDAIIMSVLPVISSLLVETDTENYSILPPADMVPYSIEDLGRIIEEQKPSNDLSEGMMYDKNYHFFGSEDFTPLYKYYNYDDARDEAKDVYEDYMEELAYQQKDPEYKITTTAEEINIAAYRLVYYYNKLVIREADVTQLITEINEAEALYGYGEYGSATASGTMGDSTQYTKRTWNYYNEVYTFAKNTYLEKLLDDEGTVRQSKITAARGLLVEAQKMLKKFSKDADYSYFDRQLSLALGKLNESAENAALYYPETVADLKKAYEEAMKFDRGYDGDDQVIIDEAAAVLETAIAGLVYMPQLAKVANTSTVLDSETGLIYGVKERISNYISYVRVLGVGIMGIEKTAKGNGTGTVITLNVNNDVLESYTVVVYGDVDGDCRADATDANIVLAYNAGFFPAGYLNRYTLEAADASNDGAVDNLDAYCLRQAGLGQYEIDQRGIL